MPKLILKCGLSPGDIVMLTAAVRDLHRCYPGKFITDVRTSALELWEHNPHITPLADEDESVEHIDCAYPLIDRCNSTPYHCLHGFIEFFNSRLHLAIRPSLFKGDIHLSPQEKAWDSQVTELTGTEIPFWLVSAGGKYDVTIKWWSTERFQAVIDQFRGQIQFVQIGQDGHHHPKLDGAIDLRGKTNIRELVRLVYHSSGVLCPVTLLMHLAAAVDTKCGQPPNRPCVVIAGGREPAHWEAYPAHQFIHTNGALRCCLSGGCWRDRTLPLRDGDKRDHRDHLCLDVVGGLPRCMDMITVDEVIHRIETYFEGDALRYLKPREREVAERAVVRTGRNRHDQQPLNLHNAGLACDAFVKSIPPYPEHYQGRGIVICGGGVRYFTCAWVCINLLRRFGCKLPIQLWHLGATEMNTQMEALLKPLGVECVDASEMRKKHPVRILHGWELKAYAMLHSPFREVLSIDADNVPLVNPGFLFETPEFRATGAIFWPDYRHIKGEEPTAIWKSCGLQVPKEREFESGQIAVDKQRCWAALCLAMWFNENSDFYYKYIHGDKETFHLAFRKLRKSYSFIPTPIHRLDCTMCQHDFRGRRIFQHRNLDKWDLFLNNRHVQGFWRENECREYVQKLQRLWNGGIASEISQIQASSRRRHAKIASLRIEIVMISCRERDSVRRQTLDNLAKTDWNGSPVHLEMDEVGAGDHRQRQTRCAFLALQKSLKRRADYILFLEDDLEFNRHLRHNLNRWNPLRDGLVTLASLYNPRLRESACDFRNNARIVDPDRVFGSQAFILSNRTVAHVVRHWNAVQGMQDIRISRLAGQLQKPILYHAPSLVQHVGFKSIWGANCFHQAMDFDPEWRM